MYIYRNFQEKRILKKATFLKFCNFRIKSWSIVFFGSDYYSLFSLKALHKKMVVEKYISNIEVVVTNDRSPVYEYSVSQNFKTHLWPPSLNGSYDFGVIVSFGKMIPKSIMELCTLGIFNIHASLLPKYRGGMPIAHALKNGDTITGVTVTKITADKFDVGEIILQKSCSIGKDELMPSLYQKLTHLGCECLLEVISTMPECLESSFPQSTTGASYAPVLNKNHAVVKWSEMTALEVFNLYRAFFGRYELSSIFKGQPIKFMCMSLNHCDSNFVVEKSKELEPGCFIYCKLTKFLYVKCRDKTIGVCTVKYKNKLYKSSIFQGSYLSNHSNNLWKFES